MKNKGFTLVETIIGATLGIMLIGSATYGVSVYQERRDLQDRVGATANQMVTFAEASYEYASAVGGLSERTIDINALQQTNILGDSFSSITPYGQELKSFVIENPSEDYFDILITTTDDPESNFIARSGKTDGSFERIQQDIYHSIRRVDLDIEGREFHAGLIKDNEFNTAGSIHRRDITSFSAQVNSDVSQPAFLLVAPEKTPENTSRVQAIWAEPATDVPANNTAPSTILVGVRSQDGQPIVNREVQWTASSGTLSASRTITDADGVARVELRNNVEENVLVTARYDGTEQSITIAFAGADVYDISASPSSNVNADGLMCSTIQMTARYPDGTPASGENIQWNTSLGVYHGTTSVTNAQGQASACLRSTEEGTATARSVIPRFNNNGTVNVQFIGPRIHSSDISASPSSGLRGDGEDYSTILVKATYPDGSPASGVRITWTTSRGNLNNTSTTTNSRGETSVRLTSTSSGNATVRATVPSGQNVSTTVGFKAPVLHSLARNKAEIDADNSDRAILTATLRYMPENVEAKGGHAVQWSTNRGTLDHNATATNTSGIAANGIRSNTEGKATITASYGGVSKSINVDFVTSYESSEAAWASWTRGYCVAPGSSGGMISILNPILFWEGGLIAVNWTGTGAYPPAPAIGSTVVSGGYIYIIDKLIEERVGCAPGYSNRGNYASRTYSVIRKPR